MRYLFGTLVYLIMANAHSQHIEYPPQCQKETLSTSAAALCTSLRPMATSADEAYYTALSKVDSLSKWEDLEIIRLQFLSAYYRCMLHGNTTDFTNCSTPVLQKVLDTLPPPANDEKSLTDAGSKARHVNAFIMNQAETGFRKCMFSRISVLDDGISSARDIAQGVAGSCSPQAYKLARVRFATMSISLFQGIEPLGELRQNAEKITNPENLTKMVLEYRAARRSKRPAQTPQAL